MTMNILDAIKAFFTDESDDSLRETTRCNNCGSIVTFDPKEETEVFCSECNMPMFKTPK